MRSACGRKAPGDGLGIALQPRGNRMALRCDSGTRNWTAAMLRPIAPAG